jgi:hypothetical protein
VFGLLRWIYNSLLDESHAVQEFSWSLDGITYNNFTMVEIGEEKHELFVFEVNPQPLQYFVAHVDIAEPDYFRLLREAESNLEDNPKSALILMVVTLEVSLKRFLILKKPEMQQVFNGDSPPSLERTFSVLLPEIVPDLTFNKQSIELLKNLIVNRNELVHQGKFPLSRQSLEKRFRFVSDVLYILDYKRGMTIFNQAFYEFEPRLENDHKKDYKPEVNIGQMAFSAHRKIRFQKRPWQVAK